MTIYKTKTVRVGHTKLEVRQPVFSGSAMVPQQAAKALETSQRWLSNMPRALSAMNPNIRAQYQHCFRAPPDPMGLNVVRSVVFNINAGLTAPMVGIKVVTSDDAFGYVRRYYKGRVHLTGGAVFYDSDGDAIHRRGEIHLGKSSLVDPVMAAVTLVHEAGHKFSNLRDFGDRGYFSSDFRNYWAPGLTHREALENADSHAQFILFMNRHLDRVARRAEADNDDGLDGVASLFG